MSRYTWDVERREDGTVVAIHPYRDGGSPSMSIALQCCEMELPALTQAVTTAHQARVAANGGRIGAADQPTHASNRREPVAPVFF